MKGLKTLTLILALTLSTSAFAQQSNGEDKIKEYINDVVEKVEQTDEAETKRVILNDSFEKLITVFERVEEMDKFSDEEKAGLTELKNTITERQNELNGVNGFSAVPNNQLNNFANFVQQDIEQADPYITISAGLAVVIILLLLLL